MSGLVEIHSKSGKLPLGGSFVLTQPRTPRPLSNAAPLLPIKTRTVLVPVPLTVPRSARHLCTGRGGSRSDGNCTDEGTQRRSGQVDRQSAAQSCSESDCGSDTALGSCASLGRSSIDHRAGKGAHGNDLGSRRCRRSVEEVVSSQLKRRRSGGPHPSECGQTGCASDRKVCTDRSFCKIVIGAVWVQRPGVTVTGEQGRCLLRS